MSWTIVVLKKGTFSADQRRVALLQDVVDALQLLAVQLSIHGSTIRDQFKVHNAIDIPPDAQHDFLAKTILTSNRWRILISWNPALRTITIDQENPLFVACHNALPEPVVQRIVEQLAADFNTSYSLCFSEFVRIFSWLLVDKIKKAIF
jgi:hypothetical protein